MFPRWTWLESDLATPPCQFGIIAGGRGSGGFSFMVPGNDDGRIAVKTTRLVGARDFVMVPMIHEFIANDPRTFGYVLEFLNEGHFVAADRRQPILEQPPTQLATQPSERRPAEVTRRDQAPARSTGEQLR